LRVASTASSSVSPATNLVTMLAETGTVDTTFLSRVLLAADNSAWRNTW
jgi:hypothetical protein